MVSISDIGKFGFGSYRASAHDEEHCRALQYALQSGCNLIDTAPNYMNGQSERLIGKSLSSSDTNSVFIVTKAGYIQGDDLNSFKGFDSKQDLQISSNFSYSLSVDFLKFQLQNSRNRLNRKWIDCLLLHNPEHYFSDTGYSSNKSEVYNLIKSAFEFLEQMVDEGQIRYYGISSNTIASPNTPKGLDFGTILSMARQVSATNHFKFLQFPFNIREKEAMVTTDGYRSLLDDCKAAGVVTMGNRPLNCKDSDGFLRLGYYHNEFRILDEEQDGKLFDLFWTNIIEQLHAQGMESWQDFPVLVFLKDNWNNLANDDSVFELFYGNLHPFLHALYDDPLPGEVERLLRELSSRAALYSRLKMTNKCREVELDLVSRNIVKPGSEPFVKRVCDHYISCGVDHVLIGMRRVKYVDDLKAGFTRRPVQN